jgi:hypothetical protein
MFVAIVVFMVYYGDVYRYSFKRIKCFCWKFYTDDKFVKTSDMDE